jgi:hypothetical protein
MVNAIGFVRGRLKTFPGKGETGKREKMGMSFV